MAGTRLAVQTMVIVFLSGLVWFSVYHGFCRSTCKKGSLTKDLPLVPGLDEVGTAGGLFNVNGNGAAAVVRAQWWEDALCHPIRAIAQDGSSFGGYGSDGEMTPSPTAAKGSIESYSDSKSESSDDDQDDNDSEDLWSLVGLKMTLVVENATGLPQWIDLISRDLQNNNGDEESSPSTFSTLLSLNPMDLEIIPPLPSFLEKDDPGTILWSHYNNNNKDRIKSSLSPPQERLIVYIPTSLGLPEEEETIEWKAYGTKSGQEMVTTTTTTTTLVLPSVSPEQGTPGSRLLLQPLVEDWMARSILAQQQQRKQEKHNKRHFNRHDDTNHDHVPTTTPSKAAQSQPKTRLTREFPIEHFMAVLMPLLFPLILPFLVSWVKEYKRYKELTASKKKNKAANAKASAAEAKATPFPAKTKAE
jgi:hypothetical protein